MRLAVYTDYVYRREGGAVYAERAFALFLAALADHVERLVIVGRLDPRSGASHYRLPDTVDPSGAQATFENGVLRMRFPRSEQAKPRRIPVTVGDQQGLHEGGQEGAHAGRSLEK